jgi:hypothetical protein
MPVFARLLRCGLQARPSGDRRSEVKEEVPAVRPETGDMNGDGHPTAWPASCNLRQRSLCSGKRDIVSVAVHQLGSVDHIPAIQRVGSAYGAQRVKREHIARFLPS